MRISIRTTLCAAALFATVGCGDTGGNLANGASPDGEGNGRAAADVTEEFTAAADALAVKLSSAAPPPADDPAVRRFEDATAHGLEALGTPVLPVSGIDSYEQLCGKTAAVIAGYLGIGTAGASRERQAEIMTRNAEQHIDQMFTPMLFSAHCTAAHMPYFEHTLTAEQVGSDPQALQQIRSVAYQQLLGLLQMAAARDIDVPRQQRIVDLLAADADKFAIIFDPQQRQELATLVRQVGSVLPEHAQRDFAVIQQALQQAPCGKLCSG